jgi:hypothetical protein
MVEVVLYLIFCILTGLYGVERRLGFFGIFLITLATTPLIVMPLLLLTAPRRRVEWPGRT